MTRGKRVDPRDLEVGERVRMYWKPYGWARGGEGLESPVVGEVYVADDHDVAIETADGKKLRLYIDKGYVMGPATNNPDTPDRTDVGRFNYFERAPTSAQRRRDATRGGARYGRPKGDKTPGDFDFTGGF